MKFKLKTITENPFYYACIILLLLYNLILVNIPLANVLGYEFAAANSLILIVLSALLTISQLKKEKSFNSLIINLITLFSLPVLISIINSVFTTFCSFADGLIFYILITFPAIIVGLSLGIFTLIFVNKYRKLFFAVLFLVLLIIPILEIYFNPQVYFYTPLIGYFPGNIYDEALSPNLKLFYHQLLVTIYFLILPVLYFTQNSLLNNKKRVVLIIIIMIPIVFHFLSPFLGFSTTFSKLESTLANKIETNNCILYYSDVDSSEATFIAMHQEYYFEKLRESLNVSPSKKISIYLFNSREQKKELFGAGSADVAKPWQYSIYISKDSWFGTLKHELSHIFAAEFGWGIFKVAHNFNAASIEGFAQAIEGNYDELDIKQITALAYRENYNINLKDLFTGLNFFKSNSLLSYNYSGAFYEFLIKEYGIEKVKNFYANGDLENSLNENPEKIIQNFQNELKSVEIIGNKNMADFYFGRLSLIQKICPRYISDRLSKAFNLLGEKKYSEAEILFKDINQKVLNYAAIVGLSEIYSNKNENEKAIKIIEDNLNKFAKTPSYFNLQFRLADLKVKTGKITSAQKIYEKLIEDNPHFGIKRAAKVRLSLISSDFIQDYLMGNDSIKYILLKNLNEKEYNYDSFPSLISLAKSLNIIAKDFIQLFNKTFIVDDVDKSYGIFKLSEYMLEIGDYDSSRKLAALSLRYKNRNPYLKVMKENFDKTNWFFYNADKLKSTFIYN